MEAILCRFCHGCVSGVMGHVALPQIHNQALREHCLLENSLCHATLLEQHDSSPLSVSKGLLPSANSVIRTMRNTYL